MATLPNILYTGQTHTTGGRDGSARSSDGRLDVQLSRFGGKGPGTNPEQLFAAGWSACFIGAMGRAAQQLGVTMPTDVAVDAEVDLASNDDGFLLQARLRISLPGVDKAVAHDIVERAHQLCPYSKATRGNIAVELSLA